MEEEKRRKVEAGREKLAAYKKKKHAKQKNTSESLSEDSSLSLSPMLLPENKSQQVDPEPQSDSSSISEHILSSSGSVENDRSFQEIEVSNLPTNFSLILQNLPPDEVGDHLSQEVKPISLNTPSFLSDNLSILSLNMDKGNPEAATNVQSILEEMLNKKVFRLNSEHSVQKSDASFNSNDTSLNIFEGVNLDDNSINNYVSRLKQSDFELNQAGESGGILKSMCLGDSSLDRVKDYEELLAAKDLTITALHAELDSLREIASNPSTLSLNTTTTEYKQYQEEYRSRFVEFENAIAHRDNLIQQLTKSLQDSVVNRDDLQSQTDHFAQEIVVLRQQLVEAASVIKQHQCVETPKSLDQNENSEAEETKADIFSAAELTVDLSDLKGAEEKNCEKASLDLEYSQLEATLSASQVTLMNDLKIKINFFLQQKILEFRNSQEQEIHFLKEKLENEKSEHETEVSRLRGLLTSVKCGSTELMELRHELDAKHAKEMEELRTYFEQKCADLEKHYSEEIFSQQSRKMSGSSSLSDAELASDILYAPSQPLPGPGGDTAPTSLEIAPTKSDLVRVKQELTSLLDGLSKYDFDTISKRDLSVEIGRHDLRALAKLDVSAFKSELQNKYHAELEILREDYENRIDLLNVDHESKQQNLERRYEERIDSLKFELDEASKNAAISVSNAVQEVASSGEYELAEVVQSYERRLQEQVTLAKIDLIAALEHQIQMLVSNPVEDEEWPTELLQLRDRFAQKYNSEIVELKEQHEKNISELKDDHLKKLSSALERTKRRSLKEESLNIADVDIVKERDNLKKTTTALRNLLGELLKYFTECEDELNNTLVDEILKHGFDKNLTQLESELILSESLGVDSILACSKRVHFTPDFSDFLNIVDNTSLDSKDFSLDLKNELGTCLERLKSDANAILALTTNLTPQLEDAPAACKNVSLEEKISSLTRQLISEAQTKNELTIQLNEAKDYAGSLESERASLENEVEQLLAKQKVLEGDLSKAREKISDLVECGHKEIISEGYGENKSMTIRGISLKRATLLELQEKARLLVAECATSADHPLLHLIDELCREGDLIVEEAKREHADLTQQIDAADKKLKATCEFLEEQAAEREQERDEAQREIEQLREQIREREKDRASCERINKEVEQLEQQMRDMTRLMEENEQKQQEVESERQDAVEKIWVLRDIIRDLESQVEAKSDVEIELKNIIAELEGVVGQQTHVNEELNQQLSIAKSIPDASTYQELIVRLEEELQTLRLNAELVGSEGALQQIKLQLHEIEVSIDKRTRDLEGLHAAISSTSCSSPTEDMSIRDQIRPLTPSSVLDECDVPLQQLSRLKEKLVKHSRAEDAAMKRIRDLEMQLVSSKHDSEELQSDKDILQDQLSEQLVLITSLQMRLDEQRLRADSIQKQTNASLEIRIYDLENEVQSLTDKILSREKTIKQLNRAVDETKQRLQEREMELVAATDDKALMNLQEEVDGLKGENHSLKAKINVDLQNAQILPSLVDNILADKNADLEKMREDLSETKKQLETYTSLNLDWDQLRSLSQIKSSAVGDILSLMDLSEPDQMRKADSQAESMSSPRMMFKRSQNETTALGSALKGSRFDADMSSIEAVGPTNFNYTVQAPLAKPNSTEIFKSAEKRVHFDVSDMHSPAEQTELLYLRNELAMKEETIKEYTMRLGRLTELESSLEKLQTHLECTENALSKATESFEKEQSELKENERTLRIELAEKKMHLIEKEKQLELEKQDSARKDQMYMNLAKEKREFELNLKELQSENEKTAHLHDELRDLRKSAKDVKRIEGNFVKKTQALDDLKEKFQSLQLELAERTQTLEEFKGKMHEQMKIKDDENLKLQKELVNKTSQVNSLSGDLDSLKSDMDAKNKQLQSLTVDIQEEKKESFKKYEDKFKQLENLVVDRECEIEILNEDINRYQNDIAKLEAKCSGENTFKENDMQLQIMKSRKEIAGKDLEVLKLKTLADDSSKEVLHLREFLKEKDRIIEQVQADSKSLHTNLEAIQNKMQESGNLVDLKSRLQEQMQLNAKLQDEIANLKEVIVQNEPKNDMCASIEEITGLVREQLDYAAHLDSSILNALHSGDSSSNFPDDLDLLKRTLHREKSRNKELVAVKNELQRELQELDARYERENERVIQLQILLENEKTASNTIQMEDANLIEQMRIRLEGALENENEFEKMLGNEKRLRQDLESQLSALKLKANNLSSSSNSKTELTEYKSLPNMDAMEMLQLRKDVQGLKEENLKLKQDIKTLKRAKMENEATNKYLTDLVKLKAGEMEKLEGRMEGMKEVERSVKEKWIEARTELDQRNREIENSRMLMAEIEQEKVDLKSDLNRLNERIKLLTEEKRMAEVLTEERDARLNSTVPEKFMKKIKDLSNLVKDHVRDNKLMTDTLAKLTEERRVLQERVALLEEPNNIQMPFDDPVARANHLFGKYLRAESYRKALIWQKNYLVALLATYQNFRPITERLPLSNFEPRHPKPTRSNGRQRFKALASMVVAVIRMHYLVQRWHSGKRLGASVTMSNRRRPASHVAQPPTAFQVGQPVSSQNFSQLRIPKMPCGEQEETSLNNPICPSPVAFTQNQPVPSTSRDRRSAFEHRPSTPTRSQDLPPWSGYTPPSKDHSLRGSSRDLPAVERVDGRIAKESPLTSPDMLSQYVERFNQIQTRLGIALENTSST